MDNINKDEFSKNLFDNPFCKNLLFGKESQFSKFSGFNNSMKNPEITASNINQIIKGQEN